MAPRNFEEKDDTLTDMEVSELLLEAEEEEGNKISKIKQQQHQQQQQQQQQQWNPKNILLWI